MKSTQEIEKWIISWFIENSDAPENEISEKLDSNYFEEGWIDSFRFIEFLQDLEDHFGVELDQDSFTDRKFATILGMVQILDSYEKEN